VLSVTILTKNSERHIGEVLESLKDFKEIVVLDSGSADNTLAIAGAFGNVRIFKTEFLGFGPLHNMASGLCTNDWILSLDSDEVVSKDLAAEIFATGLDERCVYSFNFLNYFDGKLIKCCGWYPERHVRIYNRKATRFSNAMVHEEIEQKGMTEVKLKGHVRHYSYDSVDDFLSKMQGYSSLFASNYAGRRKASPMTAAVHALFTFMKCYFLKRGVFYGYEGFLISVSNAAGTLYKYLKLYEANRKK
jgi:glycosyltransferase involved in cell wall biosynthesis